MVQLNDDVLREILEHCGEKELCLLVGVSKQLQHLALPKLYHTLHIGQNIERDLKLLNTLKTTCYGPNFTRAVYWHSDVQVWTHGSVRFGSQHFHRASKVKSSANALAILTLCSRTAHLGITTETHFIRPNWDVKSDEFGPADFGIVAPSLIAKLPCYTSSLTSFSWEALHKKPPRVEYDRSATLWYFVKTILAAPNMRTARFPRTVYINWNSMEEAPLALEHVTLHLPLANLQDGLHQVVLKACSNLSTLRLSHTSNQQGTWFAMSNLLKTPLPKIVSLNLDGLQAGTNEVHRTSVKSFAKLFPACEHFEAHLLEPSTDSLGSAVSISRDFVYIFPDDQPCSRLSTIHFDTRVPFYRFIKSMDIKQLLQRFCSRSTFPALQQLLFDFDLSSIEGVSKYLGGDGEDEQVEAEVLRVSLIGDFLGLAELVPDGLDIIFRYSRNKTDIRSLQKGDDGAVVIGYW